MNLDIPTLSAALAAARPDWDPEAITGALHALRNALIRSDGAVPAGHIWAEALSAARDDRATPRAITDFARHKGLAVPEPDREAIERAKALARAAITREAGEAP